MDEYCEVPDVSREPSGCRQAFGRTVDHVCEKGVLERFGIPNCVSQFRSVESVQLARIDEGDGGLNREPCALDDAAEAVDGVVVGTRMIAQLRLDYDGPSAGFLDQDIRPPAALEHMACPLGLYDPTAA